MSAAAAVLCVVVATLAVGSRPSDDGAPLRGVRASVAPKEQTRVLRGAALYARNDPWKGYLATEQVCPGGERTDLPVAQQVSTVACLVNFARKRMGLSELEVRSVLVRASLEKARAIIRCANFAHNPCGGAWESAVRAAGYRGEVGENLYIASGPWGAPRVAVDAWLNSPSHRRNLFDRDWRTQGLAVLRNTSFARYGNAALWVNVLGES